MRVNSIASPLDCAASFGYTSISKKCRGPDAGTAGGCHLCFNQHFFCCTRRAWKLDMVRSSICSTASSTILSVEGMPRQVVAVGDAQHSLLVNYSVNTPSRGGLLLHAVDAAWQRFGVGTLGKHRSHGSRALGPPTSFPSIPIAPSYPPISSISSPASRGAHTTPAPAPAPATAPAPAPAPVRVL